MTTGRKLDKANSGAQEFIACDKFNQWLSLLSPSAAWIIK